jgi:cytochrome c oxidase subunit 1
MSAATESTMYRTAGEKTTTRRLAPGSTVVKWMTTTDHKVIGNLYFITAFLVHHRRPHGPGHPRRAHGPGPAGRGQPYEQYNQMFTMHGTIMLLMFATPLFAGFANALMPLQIGAPTSPSRA